MRSFLIFILFSLTGLCLDAQDIAYNDSLKSFQQKYVTEHEVVKEADKQYFRFFPVKEKYKVLARFERIYDSTGFIMKTSGPKLKKYFRYGMLYFAIGKKPVQLTVYQSEQLRSTDQYKDYLFVPFTDLTTGGKSYGGGRYLEFYINEINNKTVTIDFNKCYNPYCAYASGYNCPIPPRENDLPVSIKAGEMDFAKKH
jgi:uncharacterized protein (DUF1684 family)